MKKLLLAVALVATPAMALDTTITGNVQSKCVINTDTAGVYGNPNAYKLSTAVADGGVQPIIRFDTSIAGAYKARVTTPTSFSTSPSLSDTVTWSGSTTLKKFSDAAMSDYETNKVTYDSTTEFNMHTAGSAWFAVDSTAEYGGNKALPGGTYRSVVVAECIAN